MSRRDAMRALLMSAPLVPLAMNAQPALGAALLPYDVTTFGAKGDATQDDTPAIQAAINAAKAANGGLVVFPQTVAAGSVYRCDAPLDLDSSINVTLQGPVPCTPAQATMPVRLRFVGAPPGPFIAARSSFGFTLRNLYVDYITPAYTGTLVDCGLDPRNMGLNTQSPTIEYSVLSGVETPLRTANGAILLSLDGANTASVRNVSFYSSLIGIRGCDPGGANLTQVAHISNCQFVKLGTSVRNAGWSWVLQGCNFVPGINRGANAYNFDLAAVTNCQDVTVIGCWFGDVFPPSGGTWMTIGGQNWNVIGNFFSAVGPAPVGGISIERGTSGVLIAGNTFLDLLQCVFIRSAAECSRLSILNNVVTRCASFVSPRGDRLPNSTIVHDLTGLGLGTIPQFPLHVAHNGNTTLTLDIAGNLTAVGQLRAVGPGGIFSDLAIFRGRLGPPDDTVGSDGDVYLRTDGGPMQTIYQKRAGSWVAIV